MLSLLAGQLGTRGAGAGAPVGRLIDLLLILAVRARSAGAAEETPSWLRALNDPLIAHALAAVRDRPDHPWTIESLAGEVHLSAPPSHAGSPSSSESRRSPTSRAGGMDLAARRLKDTTEPVEAIARSVGYTSEYAFNRGFKRHLGQAPGGYRRAA